MTSTTLNWDWNDLTDKGGEIRSNTMGLIDSQTCVRFGHISE